MRAPFDWLYGIRRRWFGRYTLDDPRPIAAQSPYTYHLPSENELLALLPGDLIKLVFRSHPPGALWDAERMWVEITAADGERLSGTLRNDPSDMPQLRFGDSVVFRREDAIDIEWQSDRSVAPPPSPNRRWYWERCMVDACVLAGTPVQYLYRETPDLAEADDSFPDSGWRIRGDYRDVSDAELDARESDYVALGAVLNCDDSWLPLIDAPVGAAFLRDWDSGGYVAEK